MVFWALLGVPTQEVRAQSDSAEVLRWSAAEWASSGAESAPELGEAAELMDESAGGPVDINRSDTETLVKELGLRPEQASALVSYRTQLGPLLELQELQAVPGWDPPLIRSLRGRLIFVQPFALSVNGIWRGEHQLLMRARMMWPRMSGYAVDSARGSAPFAGDPLGALFRYRFTGVGGWRWGLTAEKDPGEPWWSKRSAAGVDFVSGHVRWSVHRFIHTVILGDYQVNLGQGLVQWHAPAFGKSAEVLSVRRDGEGLRPYTSSGESAFFRGVAAEMRRRSLKALAFVSLRRWDANLVTDTAYSGATDGVSSWSWSGLHRTAAERENQRVMRVFSCGLSVTTTSKEYTLKADLLLHRFGWPVRPEPAVHSAFRFRGRQMLNLSIGAERQWGPAHLFAEGALSRPSGWAVVAGAMMALSKRSSLAVLVRNLSRGYVAFAPRPFQHRSSAANERGCYLALQHSIAPTLNIKGYIDVFHSPWPVYGYAAPRTGAECLLGAEWKPRRHVAFQAAIRILDSPEEMRLPEVLQRTATRGTQLSGRFRGQIQLSESCFWRFRVDGQCLNLSGKPASGVHVSQEIRYTHPPSGLSMLIRWSNFDIYQPSAGIFVFEKDMPMMGSIYMYNDQGAKWTLVINKKIGRRMMVSLRGSQTRFQNINTYGSSYYETKGSFRTEWMIQSVFRW